MSIESISAVLSKTIDVSPNKIAGVSFAVDNCTMLKIRDALMVIGKVEIENIEENYYIASIPAGFFNMNYAKVAIQLESDNICVAAYAKEGLINQHTCDGAITKLKEALQ